MTEVDAEIVSQGIQAATWLNATQYFFSENGMMRFSSASRRDCVDLQPRSAVLLFACDHEQHYATLTQAAESMRSVSDELKLPMRLWKTLRGRFFFMHADLDAVHFLCECIA